MTCWATPSLIQNAVRAKEKHRLPVVLSRDEVRHLFQQMSGKKSVDGGITLWCGIAFY